jgi:hypothetical protein
MKRITLFFILIAAGAILASGCDPGGAKSAAGVSANGLLYEDTSAASTVEVLSDEGYPQVSLVVTWNSPVDTELDQVGFTVSNVSTENVGFSAGILCLGLLGKSAERALGDYSLGPGESVDLTVSAADLPIHSALAFGQLFPTTKRILPEADIALAGTEQHEGLFFRHSDGFETVRVYTESGVIDSFGGQLVSLAATPDDLKPEGSTEAIGEVSNADGVFETVTKTDSGLTLRDEDGTPIGVVTSVTIGREVDESSEVEVSDE